MKSLTSECRRIAVYGRVATELGVIIHWKYIRIVQDGLWRTGWVSGTNISVHRATNAYCEEIL